MPKKSPQPKQQTPAKFKPLADGTASLGAVYQRLPITTVAIVVAVVMVAGFFFLRATLANSFRTTVNATKFDRTGADVITCAPQGTDENSSAPQGYIQLGTMRGDNAQFNCEPAQGGQ